MIAALLIAGGALAHAGWNIAVKSAGARGPYFATAALALSVAVFSPWGLPALARGVGPLLSVIGAMLLLGERSTPVALLGELLVVGGAVVIGSAGVRAPGMHVPTDSGGAPYPVARRRRGIGYGAVGVLIAAYTVWDATALTLVEFNPLGYFWASMLVQLMILLTLSARSPRTLWQEAMHHRAAVLVLAILSPLAYLLILDAYSYAPVAIVAPAREASVVLIALAGWVVFREPHPAPRILGSVVVLVGIGLLTVS